MAAVANSGSTGPASEQLPISLWNNSSNTDDVIEHAIQDDPDLAEIATRLDHDVTLDPDRDLNLDIDSSDGASDTLGKDSDSISTSSSHRDVADDGSANGSPEVGGRKNGTAESASKNGVGNSLVVPGQSSTSHSHTNGQTKSSSPSSSLHRKSSGDSTMSKSSQSSKDKVKSEDKTGKKNPLQMLKRLTKFDRSSSKKTSAVPEDYRSEFSAVVIDRLPQVFVVKYLGHRQVSGVCGLHHVRRPVDEMVKGVKDKLEGKEAVELPLLYVVVSPKGLDLREHKRNKVADSAPTGVLPIDFISYGVQDIKYWRVFTCIVVRELSSRSRSATCHAFLCDSSHNGRKMALALGAAFNVYSKKLQTAGKTHNFQVELRPPDQLADAVDAECEA